MDYELKQYSSLDEFSKEEYMRMSSYHWESNPPYRPDCFCKIGVVDNGIVAFLKCYESAPRAIYEKRDDPMYLDSCLELFVSCVEGRKEYVNVECNSNGAFLSEFGDGKYNRILVASVTSISPEVRSFKGCDDNGAFWGVRITLSQDFICDLYKLENGFEISDIRANFYKCGDDCEIQHYVAFSPVTTLPPGFHNPDCFADFKRSIIK